MFGRYYFPLGDSSALSGTAHILSIQVSPPDHYGNASNTCTGCGQGGNHQLAQDVTSQDTAGWDWIVGTPDRNTGLLDEPSVAILPSSLLLADPVAGVPDMIVPTPGPDWVTPRYASAVNLSIRVACLYVGTGDLTGTLTITVPSLLSTRPLASMPLTLTSSSAGQWVDVTFPLVHAKNVSLWWPHTVGQPTLHDANITFTPAAASEATASVAWRMGVRTVTSEVDPTVQGQVFRVNGARVFLEGGNFITPDMFQRYRNAGSDRYFTEVKFHALAGLNLLRLWGGSGGHPAALYEAADELGVLIFVEFWMSGDNNGRWAGSYSWPLDHGLYLRAATDTVRLTRSHACILLYCGGNELYPLDRNPSPDIAAALPAIIASLYPDGTHPPFVQSSMGSTYGDGPNPVFDPVRTLAPLDGPYGILDLREFAQRNPGLHYGSPPVRADSVPIAFQPELGSMSNPEYESMARFLTPGPLAQFPPANASYSSPGVHDTWRYHAYLPFSDDAGWDHVYAYGAPGNTSEYALRAQLAQYAQFRALFEGFQQHIFQWYGAVIMWKTQSPWPAFRGALYDNYLATNGGFWGVRAATGGGSPLRVQLDYGSYGLVLVNKGIDILPLDGVTVTVDCWDIARGAHVSSASSSLPLTGLAPAGLAQAIPLSLTWPGPGTGVAAGSTLLYRIVATDAARGVLSTGDYWLANLSNDTSVFQDFSALGALRGDAPSVRLQASAAGAVNADGSFSLQVQLACAAGSPQVAFAVRLTLRDRAHPEVAATGFVDDRVLPVWAEDSYFSLLPGEARTVGLFVPPRTGARAVPPAGDYVVTVDGWNVAAANVTVAWAA